MAEEKSIFEDTEKLNKDEDIPLDDLLSNIKKEKKSATTIKKIEPIEETKPEEESDEKMSALDKAILAKKPSGMVVSMDDLKKGEEVSEKRSFAMNDERLKEFNDSVNEYDKLIDKRKMVVVLEQPKDQIDYIKMMAEIDSLKQNSDGTWYFDLHEKMDDPNSPLVKPRYVRLRKEDEDIFDTSNLTPEEKAMHDEAVAKKEQEENPDTDTNKEESTTNTTKSDKLVSTDNTSSDDSTDDDSDDDEERVLTDEEKKMVEVLIDKTGFGANYTFDDAEEKRILEAQTIKINEVKTLDLSTIKINSNTKDKSFQETIEASDTSGVKVPMYFPASGFKADIKGLAYGEFADITSSINRVTEDKYRKRLSIIYNKMTNISTGAFANFEDFLKHFAWTDVYLAEYALFVASQPEIDEVPLTCGNDECGKTFNWKYAPRSVLKYDRCGSSFIKKMNELTLAPAMDYDEIQQNAIVNKSKLTKMPHSGILIEFGIISAYEYIYNYIPLTDPNFLTEHFGDDADLYREHTILLTVIRAAYAPNNDGTYTKYDRYDDILEAIYNVKPEEFQIILTYAAKILNEYNVVFSFGDVTCPHCHHKTHNLDFSIEDLVFQTYQRLVNTSIDLNGLTVF